jgi:hypothetical protein
LRKYRPVRCYNAYVAKPLESFAKYAGIATVCIEWSALLIYYLTVPSYFGGKYPISYYASLPQTHLVFSVCYTLAALSFWIFTKHHLTKHYRTPLKIFGWSMILFAGMALFPYDPNSLISTIVHSALAYSMGIAFLVGMYLLAKSADDRHLLKVTVMAIILNTILTLAFVVAPKDSNLIFFFEAGSWFVCQLWIVWISYYIYQKSKNNRQVVE